MSRNSLFQAGARLEPTTISLQTNTQPFSQRRQMIELCCQYLSVRFNWLYAMIMLRRSFWVNPHSIVCLNVKYFLEAGLISEILRDCSESQSHNHIWLNIFIISTTSFTVNPYSIVCLNIEELLDQSIRRIWSLTDSNEFESTNTYFVKEHSTI